MTQHTKSTALLISHDAIVRACRTAVANACDGDFPIDPVIGTKLSKSFSIVGSVVKRHGLLLQSTLADALAACGRFEVMTDVAVPVTEAATELLSSGNAERDLAKISLKADSKVVRMMTVDLVVVDEKSGWAGAYDVKRGNGATETRKRRPIENDLRACRLVLSSFLAGHGYEDIRKTTTAVIDYYGNSGFDKNLRLTKEQIDGHFGVPVLATVDAMTNELHHALQSEMRGLLAPVLCDLPSIAEKVPHNAEASVTVQKIVDVPEGTLQHLLHSRPTGPGPWLAHAS